MILKSKKYRFLIERGNLLIQQESVEKFKGNRSTDLPSRQNNVIEKVKETETKKTRKSGSDVGINKKIKTECFLFNDIFVILKDKVKEKQNFLIYKLNQILEIEISQNSAFSFYVVFKKNSDQEKIEFFSRTEQENSFWVKNIKESIQSYKDSLVFGVSLQTIQSREEKKAEKNEIKAENEKIDENENVKNSKKILLPQLVEKCVEKLEEEESLTEEGIFRISTGKDDLEMFKELINRNGNYNLKRETPHLATSLLRNFLRDLPESLISLSAQKEWLNFAEILKNNPKIHLDDAVDNFTRLLGLLPPFNQNILKSISLLLLKVFKNSNSNKMNEKSISICLGPNLLFKNIPIENKNLSEMKIELPVDVSLSQILFEKFFGLISQIYLVKKSKISSDLQIASPYSSPPTSPTSSTSPSSHSQQQRPISKPFCHENHHKKFSGFVFHDHFLESENEKNLSFFFCGEESIPMHFHFKSNGSIDENKVVCLRDFDLLFGKRCFDCIHLIQLGDQKLVECYEKFWHYDHFRCVYCNQIKLDSTIVSVKNRYRVFCMKCFTSN